MHSQVDVAPVLFTRILPRSALAIGQFGHLAREYFQFPLKIDSH